MLTRIKGGRVITGGEVFETDVYIRDGVIEHVTGDYFPCDQTIDAEGLYVAPGFIDLHIHGGGGYDVFDGGPEAVCHAARMHFMHGTTTLYPTSVCAPNAETERFLKDVKAAQKDGTDIPHIPGVHLEGPYMAQSQCGALNPDYIVPFDPSAYRRMVKIGEGVIKRWSFAPELPGAEAFCIFLAENGIVPSIGHSDALHADVMRVYHLGCRLMTHFYSGMSMLTRKKGYRHLGVVESGYLLNDMDVEVICDGKHLPPELLQLIYKIKGPGRICLVTDAMRAAGTSLTTSMLGSATDGLPVLIEDGVAKTPDGEAFAGSIATADRLVAVAHRQMGASLPEAVRMMTENPARIMGLHKKGAIRVGFDGDIVLFDDDIAIKRVLLGGQP